MDYKKGAAAFKYYLAGPATNNCAYGVDTGNPGNCVQDLMELILGNDANGTALAPAAWSNHPGSRRLMHLSVYLFPVRIQKWCSRLGSRGLSAVVGES